MKRREMRVVGTLNGCALWIELDGQDEEREHRFTAAQSILLSAMRATYGEEILPPKLEDGGQQRTGEETV